MLAGLNEQGWGGGGGGMGKPFSAVTNWCSCLLLVSNAWNTAKGSYSAFTFNRKNCLPT